jgi:hypothetical protein
LLILKNNNMAICDSGCTEALPFPYSNACGVVTRPGGINRIAFLQCDFEFTDITDQAEWDAAIAAGEAVVSGLLLGAKPKGSFTKKRVNSCSPERVTGGEKTVTFQDFNTSMVHGDCSIYDFYNTFLENPAAYRLVYFTCDGYAYGPIDDFTLEVDDPIDDTNTGNAYFDGSLLWNSLLMDCPELTDLTFDQDSSVI